MKSKLNPKLEKEMIKEFDRQFIREDGLLDIGKYGEEEIKDFISKWLSTAYEQGMKKGIKKGRVLAMQNQIDHLKRIMPGINLSAAQKIVDDLSEKGKVHVNDVFVSQLKQLINEFAESLIGKDEEIEFVKFEDGSSTNIGFVARNALRSEMRERKEKLLK